MKPDWDKLMEEFKDSETQLVGEVDCTSDGGKPLCEANDVRGYPTLKWGDPDSLEDYQGARTLDALQGFAKENHSSFTASQQRKRRREPSVRQPLGDVTNKPKPTSNPTNKSSSAKGTSTKKKKKSSRGKPPPPPVKQREGHKFVTPTKDNLAKVCSRLPAFKKLCAYIEEKCPHLHSPLAASSLAENLADITELCFGHFCGDTYLSVLEKEGLLRPGKKSLFGESCIDIIHRVINGLADAGIYPGAYDMCKKFWAFWDVCAIPGPNNCNGDHFSVLCNATHRLSSYSLR